MSDDFEVQSVVIDRDVEVPMRDGVMLASDIYRPERNGRYPILVHRTPYDKATNQSMMLDPVDAAQRGYVVVTQDLRGRFRSDGEPEFFRHEADDGYDTIEWAAIQEWSNGKVGMFGRSAMGMTCLQAVSTSPPSLIAAVATHAGADLRNGFIYTDGVFELGFCMRWLLISGFARDTISRLNISEEDRGRRLALLSAAQDDLWGSVEHLPLAQFPAFSAGSAPYWKEWLAHPTNDSFWTAVNMTLKATSIKIPLLHITGWYDIFLSSHMELQRELERITDPRIRRNHQFVVGPWDHPAFTHNPTAAGQRSFGSIADSREITQKLLFDWFDYWLKDDKSSGIESRPRVQYFVTGLNRWHDSDVWPPSDIEPINFYLHSGGQANSSAGDGILGSDAPSSEPPDSYLYDPRAPVPSVGGRTLHTDWLQSGIADQSNVETRPDVLVYTSAVLKEPLAISGSVNLRLFVSSSAVDTDFTAKLVDVEPTGFCANLAEGIVRARYRKGDGQEVWLTPGIPTELEISLGETAHVFLAAHRVRLEISSSNFPRFERNLNSKVLPSFGDALDIKVARQHVWHDSDRVSFLQLHSNSSLLG